MEARRHSFDDIGHLIQLTFENWVKYEAWEFWPCDCSREEAEAYKRERRKAADKERKRVKRSNASRSADEKQARSERDKRMRAAKGALAKRRAREEEKREARLASGLKQSTYYWRAARGCRAACANGRLRPGRGRLSEKSPALARATFFPVLARHAPVRAEPSPCAPCNAGWS